MIRFTEKAGRKIFLFLFFIGTENAMAIKLKQVDKYVKVNLTVEKNCWYGALYRKNGNENLVMLADEIEPGNRTYFDDNPGTPGKIEYLLECHSEKTTQSQKASLNYQTALYIPTPTNVLVVKVTDKLILTWDTMPQGVTANVFFRVGISNAFQKANKKPVTENRFEHNMKITQKRIYYQVIFENGKSKGPGSDLVSYKESDEVTVNKTILVANKEIQPVSPRQLTATYVNTYVKLEWLSDLPQTNYIVEIGTSPGALSIATNGTACCIYYHEKTDLMTTYYYRVTSISQSGKKSKPSEIIQVTTPYPKPSPVSGLTARINQKGTATLYWNGFSEDKLKGFYIYASTETKKTKSRLLSPKKFSHEFKLTTNEAYEFKMTSVNDYGQESEFSDAVLIDNN